MFKQFIDAAEPQNGSSSQVLACASSAWAHHKIKIFELIFTAHRLALEVECFLVAQKIGNASDHRMLTTFLHNWARDLEADMTAQIEQAIMANEHLPQRAG